jgi:hypothetical protein
MLGNFSSLPLTITRNKLGRLSPKSLSNLTDLSAQFVPFGALLGAR